MLKFDIYAGKVRSYLIGLHRSSLETGYQRIKSAASLCLTHYTFVYKFLHVYKFLYIYKFLYVYKFAGLGTLAWLFKLSKF